MMGLTSDHNLTAIMCAAETGDPGARDQLFARLYAELHCMARRELRHKVAMTLSPTTLLHETFMNLSQRESVAFSDRAQFMAYAARAMRGLIIDYLRSRHAQKRGSKFEITSLPTELPYAQEDVDIGNVERLGDALESLAKVDAQLAECVDLKFLCGFSFSEIAELRDVSVRTVQREWDKARLLLHRLLKAEEEAEKIPPLPRGTKGDKGAVTDRYRNPPPEHDSDGYLSGPPIDQ